MSIGILIDELGRWTIGHLGHVAVTLVVTAWAGPSASRLIEVVFDGLSQAAAGIAAWIRSVLGVSSRIPRAIVDYCNEHFSWIFWWPWHALTEAIEWTSLRLGELRTWSPSIASVPDTLIRAVLDAITPRVTGAAAGLAQAYEGTLATVRGRDTTSATQRVVGAIILGFSLLAFLYADLVIGLETFWGVFYRGDLPKWANEIPEWIRDPATGHLVASTITALALGFVILDLLGVTQLNGSLEAIVKAPPRSVLGVTRWVFVAIALVLIGLVARVAFLISFWRARAIIAGLLGHDVEEEAVAALKDGLTTTIPLMVLATAFIGVSASTLPTLLWLVVLGVLRLIVAALAVVLAAFTRALAVLTPITTIVVRAVVGLALLGAMLLAIGALALVYALVLAVPALFLGLALLALLAVLVMLWLLGWTIVAALLVAGGLDFEVRLSIGPTQIRGIVGLLGVLLRLTLRLVAAPFTSFFNWICAFDTKDRLHLRRITFPGDTSPPPRQQSGSLGEAVRGNAAAD